MRSRVPLKLLDLESRAPRRRRLHHPRPRRLQLPRAHQEEEARGGGVQGEEGEPVSRPPEGHVRKVQVQKGQVQKGQVQKGQVQKGQVQRGQEGLVQEVQEAQEAKEGLLT